MSAQPVRLIAMQCLRCQNPIPAKVNEVAWVCDQCGQGMLLSDEKGIVPLDVHYSDAVQPGAVGFPYWVISGNVRLTRKTYSGDKTREMEEFWSQPRLFFIPASQLGLGELLQRGMSLLRNPPALQEGPALRFAPVVSPKSDIRPLAEFIILSIEAERPDMLRELRFELELGEPQFWILP